MIWIFIQAWILITLPTQYPKSLSLCQESFKLCFSFFFFFQDWVFLTRFCFLTEFGRLDFRFRYPKVGHLSVAVLSVFLCSTQLHFRVHRLPKSAHSTKCFFLLQKKNDSSVFVLHWCVGICVCVCWRGGLCVFGVCCRRCSMLTVQMTHGLTTSSLCSPAAVRTYCSTSTTALSGQLCTRGRKRWEDWRFQPFIPTFFFSAVTLNFASFQFWNEMRFCSQSHVWMITPVKPVGFSLRQRCIMDDTCWGKGWNDPLAFLRCRETAGSILCRYTRCLCLFYQNNLLFFFYLLLRFIRQIVSFRSGTFSVFCFVFHLWFRVTADLQPSVLNPESAVRLDRLFFFSFHNQFYCLPKPKTKMCDCSESRGRRVASWRSSVFFPDI